MATTRHGFPTIDPTRTLRNGPADINAALQAIDDVIAVAAKGTLAARPVSTSQTPGKVGRLYHATDSGASTGGRLFFDTGTTWLEVTRPALVTALPSDPYDGQVVNLQTATMATRGLITQWRYRLGVLRWEQLDGGEVEGVVAFNGTVLRGTGFTVLKSVTAGDYGVTFTTPFAAPPVITLTLESPRAGARTIHHYNVDETGFGVNIFAWSPPPTSNFVGSDEQFHFRARLLPG